ncbi:hypothetical protein EUV02_13505 [Polymorphobacter arshaanensis]|uniref:PepSY domain-containing protein n=1 Tax=Glacieibacterium arshaanense TaxID=2511025 RepID=A0A4Y9ELJ2_9SPHN|nr:hypothetical protein [Polymorphobacter arshaanensis]TFU01306.1 hypothetical protein EUV02_13505 [Polymorphobacter arshaanensis]
MTKITVTLGALIFAASLGMSSAAIAVTPTAIEKAELSMLTPAKQKEVLARAVNGNTISGVIETMLLNQISDDFANGDAISIDFTQQLFVVRNKKGQLHEYVFDTATLTVTPPKKK